MLSEESWALYSIAEDVVKFVPFGAEFAQNDLQGRHALRAIAAGLFGVAALAVGMVGYNDGLGNQRHFIGGLLIIVLLVAIIWVTIDLDLPQYGLIRVNQQSMLNLQDFIAHDLP